jgi:hypothetical protein
VLERVYPSRWISPLLSKAGGTVTLPLEGYETAIYEVYPLKRATLPLVAGVVFETGNVEGKTCRLSCYPDSWRNVRILNPGTIASLRIGGKDIDPGRFVPGGMYSRSLPLPPVPPPVRTAGSRAGDHGDGWEFSLRVDSSSHNGMLALLVKPAGGEQPVARPSVTMVLDGMKAQPDVESQKGMWAWYTLGVGPGSHTLSFAVAGDERVKSWNGTATGYFICDQALPAEYVSLEMKETPRGRPMPPAPAPPGTFRVNTRLGESNLSVTGGR